MRDHATVSWPVLVRTFLFQSRAGRLLLLGVLVLVLLFNVSTNMPGLRGSPTPKPPVPTTPPPITTQPGGFQSGSLPVIKVPSPPLAGVDLEAPDVTAPPPQATQLPVVVPPPAAQPTPPVVISPPPASPPVQLPQEPATPTTDPRPAFPTVSDSTGPLTPSDLTAYAEKTTAARAADPGPRAPAADREMPRVDPDANAPTPITSPIPIPSSRLTTDVKFQQVLRDASIGHTVIVSVGNAGYLPMLVNLIRTSILRFRLSNFIVIALSKGMCSKVPGGVHCYEYPDAVPGGDFGSAAFAKLVNVKTEVLMASVKLGYRTLLVDGDIVFLKDPLPYLQGSEDLLIQDDDAGGRNSGFMMCNNSPWSLAFLGRSLAIAQQASNMRQQEAVNKALGEMNSRPEFRMRVLDRLTFPCGMMYFEKPMRRMFATEHPCDDCVIMHNNWIVGTAAKVYRFKEHLQWMVDTDEYYSSRTARYLQVDLPDKSASLTVELEAVKNAFRLAALLNRIVILPPFHCHGCKVDGAGGSKEACSGRTGDLDQCNILAHFSVSALDASGLKYRESMFRRAALVPSDVAYTDNEANLYFIATNQEPTPKSGAYNVKTLIPKDMQAGPTHAELVSWFPDSERVIHLHSLYHVDLPLDSEAQRALNSKLDTAFKKATYRQY